MQFSSHCIIIPAFIAFNFSHSFSNEIEQEGNSKEQLADADNDKMFTKVSPRKRKTSTAIKEVTRFLYGISLKF